MEERFWLTPFSAPVAMVVATCAGTDTETAATLQDCSIFGGEWRRVRIVGTTPHSAMIKALLEPGATVDRHVGGVADRC